MDWRNALQAASNEAAGTVSGPVDLIAMALRAAGVPVPQDPVMGSEWLRQRGLMADVRPGTDQVLGATAGLLAPTAMIAKAPQIASGLLKGADNLAAPRTLNPQTGAIVWHGSPHKFDKFDSSKIGTGEGAQAYGHGLYLADNQGVAGSYRLPNGRQPEIKVGGKVLSPNTMEARAFEDVARLGKDAALQKIDDNIKFNSKYAPDMADMYRTLREKIAATVPDEVAMDAGSLYKVDLPDDKIAKMLDWDKPLSEQAPEVREAFRNLIGKDALGRPTGSAFNESEVGRWAYEKLQRDRTQNLASRALKEQGIPGIRYLDGGSRSAGAGSRNYVVFPGEEDALRILERNGQGLLGP